MRKIFTLAMLFAAAVSMSAFTPVKDVKDAVKMTTTTEITKAEPMKAIKANKALKPQKVASRATSATFEGGQYDAQCIWYSNKTPNFGVRIGMVTVDKDASVENGWIVNGLFAGFFTEETEPLKATWDAEKGALIIPTGQLVTTMDDEGETREIKIIGCDENDKFVNEGGLPIELYLDGRNLVSPVDENGYVTWNCYLGFYLDSDDDEVRGFYGWGQVMDLSFNMWNGYCLYYPYDSEGAEDYEICPIYTECKGNKLVVSNIYELGYDLDPFFSVDRENGTVTATDQVVYAGYADGEPIELFLSDIDDSGSPTAASGFECTGEYYYDDEYKTGSIIEFGLTGVFTENDTPYDYILGSMIQLNYDLDDPDGIEAIATDNANAPVVYYNLQGIRVNKPMPGTIVIRRQGNECTKVLVK